MSEWRTLLTSNILEVSNWADPKKKTAEIPVSHAPQMGKTFRANQCYQ